GGRDRRHHPDRSARGGAQRPARGPRAADRDPGHRVPGVRRSRRGAAPIGAEDHRGLRAAGRRTPGPGRRAAGGQGSRERHTGQRRHRRPSTRGGDPPPRGSVMPGSAPAPGTSTTKTALRALSPRPRAVVDSLDRVVDLLSASERSPSERIVRPHPLLVMLRRGEQSVLIVPAAVWDEGRDLLRPYLERLAAYETRLLIVGRPKQPDLAAALNLGLGALLDDPPSAEQLTVALHQAFELMEVKARSESRGKWLNRYRYELGELIEIARAITTEKEIDKLLGLILEKS